MKSPIWIPALEKITVASDNANYCDKDGVLYSKDGKTLLFIPGKATKVDIGSVTLGESEFNMFRECTGITSITGSTENYSTKDNKPAIYSTDGKTLYYASAASTDTDAILDGVETIETKAFCKWTTTEVSIPASVKTIKNEAFYCCDNLSQIIFAGTKDQWNAINKENGWRQGNRNIIFKTVTRKFLMFNPFYAANAD